MDKDELIKEFDALIEAHYKGEIDSIDEWFREVACLKHKIVKKLNIDDVSKCECGETKDLITVCEDCTYKMVSEGN